MSFEPSGFFVLRAPLLSIDAWQRWGDDADLEGQRAFIRAHLERPEIREALALASRSLQDSLASWTRDPDSEGGQKVERALVRYLSRMSTRPTPFGLFAGCGVGELGDRTEVRVPSLAAHRRHTRLDNDYLVQLTEDLLRRPSVRQHVRYRPNNSLCEHGEQLRYVEPQRAGQDRTYSLVVLESNEFVSIAVERARDGATASEIARALVASDPEVDLEEASGFVDSLIDSHILISDLEPAVTGREPIHELIDALAEIPGVDAEKSALLRVRQILAGIDEIRPFRPQDDAYAEIERELETTGTSADRQHLLQVDMQLGLGQATLHERIVPELVRAATFVMQYCPQPGDVYMSEFCRRFEQRYERAEVPLLEVLDEDSGIGFGQLTAEGNDPEPMLAGVNLARGRKQAIGRVWGAFEEVLLRKLEAMVPGQIEIELSIEDFAHAPPEAVDLPDACALNVTVAAQSAAAIDAGDYRAVLHLVDGPSAVNWLGRFCHGDPTMKAHVERALRQEEALRPDAVFAEIVHLPEGRTGNVLHRPVLREYEIPVLSRSGADAEHQLPPEDLLVTVWDGRVVLKSKRLGKEVIPRLCSAHAFPNPTNIGLYRFLGFLQTGGLPMRTSWTWGALDPQRSFVPRVVMGRVVLSLARWALKSHMLAPLYAATRAERWEAMQELRRRLDLPRHVSILRGDNVMPIDLENRLSVESAIWLLKREPVANLVEVYPPPAETWVEGPEGPLTHEIVLPIVRSTPATQPADTPWLHTSSEPVAVRRFIPGSEWLYLKLYASPRSCDRALLALAPSIRDAQDRGDIDRWFFLRFGDSEGWHLRLRLHGDPTRLMSEVLPRVHAVLAPMVADRQIWNVQLDSYHREVEHWGGPRSVLLAEDFLWHDSEAVLSILERYADDPSAQAQARWQLALLGVDALWSAIGLPLEGRRDLAEACRDALRREFNVHAGTEKQLSHRFRSARKGVEALFEAALPEGRAILDRRTDALAPVFAQMHALHRDGLASRSMIELAPRFAHLHVNRILRSKLREQEFVLMDMLTRHLRSMVARAKVA